MPEKSWQEAGAEFMAAHPEAFGPVESLECPMAAPEGERLTATEVGAISRYRAFFRKAWVAFCN